MTDAGQLAMPVLFNAYWVTVKGHGTIPDGTRFLIVDDWGDGKHLAGWRDGIEPRYAPTLLKHDLIERIGE